MVKFDKFCWCGHQDEDELWDEINVEIDTVFLADGIFSSFCMYQYQILIVIIDSSQL